MNEPSIRPFEKKIYLSSPTMQMCIRDRLDNDKSTDADRKYMIVVSDGITYMYNESPTVVAGYWLSDGSPYFSRDPYSWQFKYGNNDAPDDWDAWMRCV